MKNNLLKGITIFIFIALVSCFVAFKSGAISLKEGATVLNDNPNDSTKVDSPKIKNSPEIIPSSKMMIMTDHPINANKKEKDTIKDSLVSIDKLYLDDIMMGSSKSAPSFNLDDIKLIEDILTKDSIKAKQDSAK